MSQKLPLNKFELIEDSSQFNADLAKSFSEESDEEYFPEVHVQYHKKLHEIYNGLPFLPFLKMEIEKVEKRVTHIHDKNEYVIQIRNLKQVLNHGVILKKVHSVIKLNQSVWLKLYIDMNTELRQKAKNNFDKEFLKVMSNAVLGKIMENVRKHKNNEFATTERRRNYLLSEPNNHTTKFFMENLLAIEMRKTQILMKKPVYLPLSMLDV